MGKFETVKFDLNKSCTFSRSLLKITANSKLRDTIDFAVLHKCQTTGSEPKL